MSFGKKKVNQPRWLDEEELEEVLIQQGNYQRKQSGMSIAGIAGIAVVVVLVFVVTFFGLDMM